ncbi:hypothetical protein [Tropicibacter sp. S64]|uniref:hypothetical protein n=1 Tax=Tropicibacter sp. S64 TaxID=3415122 RepID=UPI003C7D7C79
MTGYFDRLGARLTPEAIAPVENAPAPVRLSLPEGEVPDAPERVDPAPVQTPRREPGGTEPRVSVDDDIAGFDAVMGRQETPVPLERAGQTEPSLSNTTETPAEALAPMAPISDLPAERTDVPETHLEDRTEPGPILPDPVASEGERDRPEEVTGEVRPKERVDLEALLSGFFGEPDVPEPARPEPMEPQPSRTIEPPAPQLMPDPPQAHWEHHADPDPAPDTQPSLTIGEIRVDVIEPKSAPRAPAPAPTPLRQSFGPTRPARRRFGLDQS